MSKTLLDTKTSRYLEFLRFSLRPEAPLPVMEDMDWDGLMAFGEKQSVLGVLFHGVNRLTNEVPRPGKQLVFQWLTYYNEIKRNNEQVSRNASMLTRQMYAEQGFKGCILKGQGNAMMYPDPYMRTPGDIDIWFDVPALEAIRYARTLDPDTAVAYHHVDAPSFRGTPVEIHFKPSYDENVWYDRRLQHYFEQHKAEQFKTFVKFPGGEGAVCVPTDEFNLVFQMSHMHHHFFTEGIGLRQMIDYYYLLRRGFTAQQKAEAVASFRRLNLYKFARGVMYVMAEALGLEEDILLLKPDRRVGQLLLDEILEGGNFGFHDQRYRFRESKSILKGFLLYWRRNLRFALLFPSEILFGHSLFVLYWHYWYEPRLQRAIREHEGKEAPHA